VVRKIVKRNFRFCNGRKGSAITVIVTSNAGKNALTRIDSNGTLEISLKSTASSDRHDHDLVAFLSDLLKVPLSNIEIVAGRQHRIKLISILDVNVSTLQARIQKLSIEQ
jgi:uncharacterized protein YggU (UPF0235/DUF167 family)